MLLLLPPPFLMISLWPGCIFLVYFLFRDTYKARPQQVHNKSPIKGKWHFGWNGYTPIFIMKSQWL